MKRENGRYRKSGTTKQEHVCNSFQKYQTGNIFSKASVFERLPVSSEPGHPDIYLKKYNTAVFVHGCFWHRHDGCKYAYTPKSRIEFWMKKFENNQRRDREVTKELSSGHIKQLIIWECTIKQMNKNREKEKEILGRAELFLESEELYLEL